MVARHSKTPDRLYSRQQARELLGGVSTATLIRLEQAGKLKPVKFTKKPQAKVFYTGTNMAELVEEAADVSPE